METKILFFLLTIFFAFVINAGLMFAVHKMFAGISGKVKDVVDEFEKSGTREWLESMRVASEQAVRVSAVARERIVELDPQLENFHNRFRFMLAQIDTKVERITRGVSDNATLVRDVVADRAEKFAAVAAGITSVLAFAAPPPEEDTSAE